MHINMYTRTYMHTDIRIHIHTHMHTHTHTYTHIQRMRANAYIVSVKDINEKIMMIKIILIIHPRNYKIPGWHPTRDSLSHG